MSTMEVRVLMRPKKVFSRLVDFMYKSHKLVNNITVYWLHTLPMYNIIIVD